MPEVALRVLNGGCASNSDAGCSSAAEEDDARREFDTVIEWINGLAGEPRTFFGVELALVSRVFALGRLLVRLYLACREERVASTLPKRVRVDGQWYERRPRQQRSLRTFFGKVLYWRTYLIPEGRQGHGFHPVDKELGLSSDSFSLHLVSLACRLAVDVSFEGATEWLLRFLGHSPAKDTIEHMVLGLGVYTQAFFDALPSLLSGDGEVLVIIIDQKAVPTATLAELRKRRGKRRGNPHPESARHRGRQKRRRQGPKKRRRKGDKSKNGRAATLVVMYTLRASPADGLLLGPINKVSYGSFAGKRYGFAWARRQAEKRGFGPGSNKLIQFVSDGDDDFPVYLEEYFADYAEHEFMTTLDLYHVMEYVWKAGTARHREGSDELAAWAQVQKTRLVESRADLLLADLRRWLKELPKTGPGNKSKRERISKAIGYIEKNLYRMDYKYVRECDLELASGAGEGAINHVIALRMDHGGMRWIRERAEALLQLRCIAINEHWDAFIQWVQGEIQRCASRKGRVRIRRKTPAPLPTIESLEHAA